MSKIVIATTAVLSLAACSVTSTAPIERPLAGIDLDAPVVAATPPLGELSLAAEPTPPTTLSSWTPTRQDEPDPSDWSRRLIDPVSAPFLFETPVIHSSVQPVFLYHDIPATSVLGGGNLRGYAVQLRYAITDRLAFIAIQDGRIDFNPGGPDSYGWADVAGGLKYMLYEDQEAGEIITIGLTYEGTQGSSDVLYGNGEGGFRPFVSAGWDDGDSNALATIGAYLPVDGDAESQVLDYHLQFSWELDDVFVPLVEINGLYYTDGGRALVSDQEGIDYVNLGSSRVEGNSIITGAIGFRWRFADDIDFGLAVEDTITAREDIFGARVTADMIYRF